MRFAIAVGIDVVMVLVFAVAGRRTHDEGDPILGVLDTAWPFLVAAVVGSLIARGWRKPYGRSTAIIVWITTVLLGMGLRLLSGDTAAWPFWIVTFLVLGILLLGWRLVARRVKRRTPADRRSSP